MCIPCGNWRCARCGEAKAEAIWQNLSEVTMPHEPLYDAHVPARQADAVRKAVRRLKASYLGMLLTDKGLYLVTDQEASGWGWTTQRHDWEDLMAELPGRLQALGPARTTWVGHWKPEPQEKREGDVVFRGVASSPTEMRETLLFAGIKVEDEEVKGDPLAKAQQLTVVFEGRGRRTAAGRNSR